MKKALLSMVVALTAITAQAQQSANTATNVVLDVWTLSISPYTWSSDSLSWVCDVTFTADCIAGQYYMHFAPGTYWNGSSFHGVIKTAPVGTAQTVRVRTATLPYSDQLPGDSPKYLWGSITSAVYRPASGSDIVVPHSQVGIITYSRADWSVPGLPSGRPEGSPNMQITIGAPPPKSPEPWALAVQNQSSTSQIVVVKDPFGNTVYTYGVGKNQNGSAVYQPPDNPPIGTYVAGIGSNTNSGYNLLYYQTAELVVAPGGSEYSHVWTLDHVEFLIPPTGADGTGSAGTATNNSGVTQTIGWYDDAGNLVGTTTSVASGGAISLVPPTSQLPAGTTQRLTARATAAGGGGTQTLGTVTIAQPIDDFGNPRGLPIITGTINATMNPPAGGPQTPTTAQTNTGNTPTGTQTNNPQTNTGGTAVNNGASTTITNQDFYNNVRNGVKDALADMGSGGGGTGGPARELNTDSPTLNRGKLDQVQGKIDSAITKTDEAREGLKGKLAGLTSKLSALPTSLGQQSTMSFGTYNFGSNSTTLTLDLAGGPVGSKIPILRAAILFVLSIGFIAAIIRMVRYYL